ncbi:MAG: PadR family transcriptional regulator [Acidobacteriota bacterium]|jgi:DNA-binding PadR family transcriptional regulator
MKNPVRMTYATALVLEALDQGHVYGFDIIDATRLRSGTVYPLLRRLEDAGLVRSKWEKVAEARRENRPPRKYYELRPAATAVMQKARARYPAVAAMELAR